MDVKKVARRVRRLAGQTDRKMVATMVATTDEPMAAVWGHEKVA